MTHADPSNFFETHQGLWAFGSALAAFLALALTIIGLLFIWGQLKATREALSAASISANAASEAARISYSATRPWVKLKVTGAYLYFEPASPEVVGCQVNYGLENIGKTPAIHCGIFHRLVPTSGWGNLERDLEQLRREGPRTEGVLFPGEVVEEGISTGFPIPPQRNETSLSFHLLVAVFYQATPQGERYWTPGVFMLLRKPGVDANQPLIRGMGTVEFTAARYNNETPPPT